MQTPTPEAAYSVEQRDALQQALLAACYKESGNKLLLQQRAQRIHLAEPLPALPASLQRRRRSSTRRQSTPQRVLLTGKTLPSLQALLGEPTAEQVLDESVLNALKFERDLDALRGVFDAAAAELHAKQPGGELCSTRLEQAIGELSGNKSEESVAAAELQGSRDELKALQAELEQLQLQGASKLKNTEERIAEAKYNLRCVSRVNDLEYNLVERWEAGRITQGEIWGENAERAYLRDILDYKQRLAHEERVSSELRAFRAKEAAELRGRIAEWQQKYATELRRVEREAQAWEMRIFEVQKSLERHREVYEERRQFVREYRAQKEEEQRQHELQLHRMECAVRLQAWWRGTMVRRGLGPFKKRPKKGKRGKGSKK